MIGGVLGPITRPEVVIAGLYRGDDLVIVGRTVPLSPAQPAELGAVLTPAKPGHPWPNEISSQRWGGKDSKKPLTKVEQPRLARPAIRCLRQHRAADANDDRPGLRRAGGESLALPESLHAER